MLPGIPPRPVPRKDSLLGGGTYLPVERENRTPFSTLHVGRACPGKATDEVVIAVWFHNSRQVHTMWEGPSHTRAGNGKERTGHPRAQHAKNLTRGFKFGTAQTGMPQGVNHSSRSHDPSLLFRIPCLQTCHNTQREHTMGRRSRAIIFIYRLSCDGPAIHLPPTRPLPQLYCLVFFKRGPIHAGENALTMHTHAHPGNRGDIYLSFYLTELKKQSRIRPDHPIGRVFSPSSLGELKLELKLLYPFPHIKLNADPEDHSPSL